SISEKLPLQELKREFIVLHRNAETTLREEGWKGAIRYQPSVDMRYRGQGHELNIPYSRGLVDDFRREHQRRYGYSYPDRGVELVTLGVRVKVKSEHSSGGGLELSSFRAAADLRYQT